MSMLEKFDLLKKVKAESIVLTNKTICIDLETTGFDFNDDEVIQCSIIDADGKVLMNEYIKPYFKTHWEEAEAVNGISPKMLADKPTLEEVLPKIKGIIEDCSSIIGYNTPFDLSFVARWGVDLSEKNVEDVMRDFAPIYGEYNEKYGGYKWKKLTECANYYGYQFKAHDSLEDVKATMFCYKKIKNLPV